MRSRQGSAPTRILWYHLGLTSVARSTLADANERRSFEIYKQLFGELLARCKEVTPASRTFTFTNSLYALDSTTVTLCLSLFNWAHYSRQKGALKLHTLLDIRSAIPEIVTDSHGEVSDVQEGRVLDLSTLKKGSILVMDRGYCDYAWWRRLSEQDSSLSQDHVPSLSSRHLDRTKMLMKLVWHVTNACALAHIPKRHCTLNHCGS